MGDTPEGYGGGTPPSTPGGVPPGGAKPVQDINEALKTMAQAITDSSKLTRDLVAHLERANATVTKTGQSFDYAHTELKSLLKDTANLEYSMKRIQKLQAARVGAGSSKSGTLEYVKNLQAEYKVLLQVLNTGKGQGRYVKDVEKALEGLEKKLKQVEKQNDRTWDSKAIQDINSELVETAKRVDAVRKSMEKIQVDKMSKGFRDLGRAVDDAFGGQLSNTLQRIPGITGAMKAMRLSRQAGVAHRAVGDLDVKRSEKNQAAWKANAQLVYQQHGRGGIQAMRRMGYAGGAPVQGTNLFGANFKGRGRSTRMLGAAQAQGTGPATRQGGSLDQMTVKTLVVQNMQTPGAKPKLRMDPQTGKFLNARGIPVDPATGQPEVAASESTGRRRTKPGVSDILSGLRGRSATPTSVEDVQKTMHGSGGLFSKTLNKLVGGVAGREGGGFMARRAQSLLAQGAGSASAGLAEGAVGVGSGLLRGGLGLASKAAVPMAIIGGLVQMRDKVAEENKKLVSVLADAGGFTTGGPGDFHNIRKSLLSTGFSGSLRMGQGLEENLKVMGTMGEGGLATGKSLRQGLNLRTALDQQGGLSGGGYYGSVMKNAVYSGKNLGMGQDASTRLTMKLIEKFGKTTEDTQKFFLGMDDMMQHSGISASKYIQVIDDVTGQFDEMNRSLNNTLGILSALGKNGRLTGDALKEMVSTITKPTQMTTAQRMYNAKLMVDNGGAAEGANALREANKGELQGLMTSLTSKGVPKELTGANGELIQQNRTRIEQFLQEHVTDKTELKGIVEPMRQTMNRVTSQGAQADALASNDPGRIAGAMELGGESGISATMARRAMLRKAADLIGLSKGDTKKLLGGDQGLLQRVLSGDGGKNNLLLSQLQSGGTLMSGENFMKDANAFGEASRSGAMTAVGFGQGATDAAGLLGGSAQDRAKYSTISQLQRARISEGQISGKGKSEEDLVNDFIKESKNNSQNLAESLTKLDKMFDLTTLPGALQQALEGATTAQAAKEKAQTLATNTRTTAEVFASAFEDLFAKVVNGLDGVMDILDPLKLLRSKKQDNGWAEDQVSGLIKIMEGKDTSKMTPEALKVHQATLAQLKDGSVLTGDPEEVKKKLLAATEEVKQQTPDFSAQSQEMYGKAAAKGVLDSWKSRLSSDRSGVTVPNLDSATNFMNYTGVKAGGDKAVGALLTDSLQGMGGDTAKEKLMGEFAQANFSDIQRNYNAQGVALTSASPEATALLEQAMKARPDLFSNTSKDSQGNITTYITYSSQHTLSQSSPRDSGAGSQASPAKFLTPGK